MPKNVPLIALLGVLAIVACHAQSSPQGDSQSHWLRACRVSSECGDAECMCGVCSRSCNAQSECGKAADTLCTELAAVSEACPSTIVSAAVGQSRICLARCDSDAACAGHGAGLSCVAGTCVGSPAAAPIDAGHAMQADAGSTHAGQATTSDAAVRTETPRPQDGGQDATLGDAAADAGLVVEGGPGDAVCTAYVPEATASPTSVRFVNTSNENIYMGPTGFCNDGLRFTLASDDGVTRYPQRGGCANTCLQMQQGQCPIACEPGCSSAVTQVAPGGSYFVEWPGTVITVEQMPAQCYGSELCMQGQCAVERTPPETLTLQALAYPEFVCSTGACTTCTPDASGICTVLDTDKVGGTPVMREVTWTRGQSEVSIEF